MAELLVTGKACVSRTDLSVLFLKVGQLPAFVAGHLRNRAASTL